VSDRVRLGRTDLEVCRIGIGGGNSLTSEDLEYAVSRGANYVFTSCDLHAHAYSRSWAAIRKFCSRGTRRGAVHVAACSYVNDAEKLFGVVADQIASLQVDYVDVFQWGWMTTHQPAAAHLAATDRVLRTELSRRWVDSLINVTRQVGDELYRRGYARYLAVSTHDRALARSLAADPNVDVLMIRYNRDHPGAEDDIFPHLDAERPGIVAFNVAHASEPARDAAALTERYRYALRRSEIDLVLAGPSNRAEIDAALDALEPAAVC
jgi:aryl-alcohol dehydrogenase-like predicted oxidoreductase